MSIGTKPNLLEIAVFDNDTKKKQCMDEKAPLIMKKAWVKPRESTFTFITKKLPIKEGIDPYNKIIDRIPDDNIKTLEEISK
jgi:hypothetical protein